MKIRSPKIAEPYKSMNIINKIVTKAKMVNLYQNNDFILA